MPDDEEAYFEEACSYFKEAGASTIFALGHWNDGGQTVSPQMSTPDLRTKLSTIEGCDLGESLTYMDGHTCVGEKGVEGCLDLAEKWL
ncbi:hypothetical protein TrLO_g8272 [Triparma laevis f. longispina]|uniref:Uncharacterized protein n=1 Tax=Triparma laevis f. longispina TaxID=1714387 RepID=A0A9W7CMZ9_9STRA|nr:hypothetical protein TrLO_g8272 [Triparma laevis f. longispina]